MSKPANGGGEEGRLEELTRAPRDSLIAEFIYYLRRYRRWSMIPILIALALLGVFVSLSGTGAAPFIYALF